MTNRQLGPILGATLITRDLNRLEQAYCQQLGFTVQQRMQVSPELAALWQTPDYTGCPLLILAAANGEAWLRVVEVKDAPAPNPLRRQGWMALEVNVASVDAVRQQLSGTDFTIIGEPAFLQVSDAIKAMQVIGPAGEVLYLTEVQRPVPPFELPQTSAFTAGLFIPVLAVPDRQQAVTFYQELNQAAPALQFNTKITVLNNAWGLPLEQQYPVATLQLDGQALFEIDELPVAAKLDSAPGQLPSGIALISCFCQDLQAVARKTGVPVQKVVDAYYPAATGVILLKGAAGEVIELVQQP